MDELSILMQRLVDQPCAPLDFDGIAARGWRRRRRRWAGEASAVCLALVLAASAWTTLLEQPGTAPVIGQVDEEPSSARELPDHPIVEDANQGETPPTVLDASGSTRVPPVSDGRPAPSVAAGEASPGVPDSGPTVTRDADPGADDEEPDGCEVVTGSCSFVARGPGGFRAEDGDWSITVERDGVSTVYTAARDGMCGDDIIQAGDHVVVDAAVGEDVGPVEGGVFAGYKMVGAGADYGC